MIKNIKKFLQEIAQLNIAERDREGLWRIIFFDMVRAFPFGVLMYFISGSLKLAVFYTITFPFVSIIFDEIFKKKNE